MNDETLAKKILSNRFWNTDDEEEKENTGDYKAFGVTPKYKS